MLIAISHVSLMHRRMSKDVLFHHGCSWMMVRPRVSLLAPTVQSHALSADLSSTAQVGARNTIDDGHTAHVSSQCSSSVLGIVSDAWGAGVWRFHGSGDVVSVPWWFGWSAKFGWSKTRVKRPSQESPCEKSAIRRCTLNVASSPRVHGFFGGFSFGLWSSSQLLLAGRRGTRNQVAPTARGFTSGH